MLKSFSAIIVLFLIVGFKLHAQDTASVTDRKFNKTQIEQLVQQDKYQYEIPAKAPIGFWQRIKWFLNRWFNRIFGTTTSNTTLRYVVLIVVIVVAVFQLIKANLGSVVGKDSQNFQHTVFSKNHDPFVIDYGQQLHEAENQQNYREAIRLWHLKTLKALHHGGYIRWKNYKTNADFAHELDQADMQEPFKKLIRFFEYIWYGEFPLALEQYQEIRENYQQFIEKLMPQNSHE